MATLTLKKPNQAYDPEIMLRMSDDGGNIWTGYKTARIGKTGEYKLRIRWDRLGASRDRIFELSMTDPVKCVIVDAFADIEIEN
jgi:hypothetical protein